MRHDTVHPLSGHTPCPDDDETEGTPSAPWQDTIVSGNPLIRLLGSYASGRLIGSAEKFAGKLRDGEPPMDYAAKTKNYLIPEF